MITKAQKDQALTLLASGKTVREVSAIVGMSKSYVSKLSTLSTPLSTNPAVHCAVHSSTPLSTVPDYSRVVPLVQRISSAIDALEKLLIARSTLSPYLVQEALEPARYVLSELKIEMASAQQPQPVVGAIAAPVMVDPLAAELAAPRTVATMSAEEREKRLAEIRAMMQGKAPASAVSVH
jgi:hypothetical protein